MTALRPQSAGSALTAIEKQKTTAVAPDSGRGGYVLNGRHYCGATVPLRAAFYQNYKNPQRRRGGSAKSSKICGTNLHRHAHHRYVCKEQAKTCTCSAHFGGARSARTREDSSTRRMLDAVDRFLKQNGWSVLSCEVPCVWPAANCATAADMICCNSDRSRMLVVELKTGYGDELFKARTDRDTRTTGILGAGAQHATTMMQGEEVRVFLECTPYNQHQLQMWFTSRALLETYGHKPDRCVAIYLKPDGTYWTHYSAPWWISKGEQLEKVLLRSRSHKTRSKRKRSSSSN